MLLLELATTLGQALTKHKLSLCSAESCTAGGLSYWITSVPGSSDWFDRGFITYSNAAKEQMLGVSPISLTKHGAVSEEVAREMAQGAIANSQCDISIAITGIAGPDGGTKDKPVGTVWFACCNKKTKKTSAEMKLFTGDREAVRHQCIEYGLNILLQAAKI